MQQARDFLDECRGLEALLRPLPDDVFETQTAFKSWSFNNILRHLHVWNVAADLSLRDGDAFMAFFERAAGPFLAGKMTEFESEETDGLCGAALLDKWIATAGETAAHFADADPSMRVVWAGPSMSARSSISARHMETWAHGQAIFDALGVRRINEDRIKNIVIIGVNTYGWTFKNRGTEPPGPMPVLELTAPSGAVWTFGEGAGEEKISGLAEEFCQVVTQCRNIADTRLQVEGANAKAWMSNAQCFAGPAATPPKPGVRGIAAP